MLNMSSTRLRVHVHSVPGLTSVMTSGTTAGGAPRPPRWCTWFWVHSGAFWVHLRCVLGAIWVHSGCTQGDTHRVPVLTSVMTSGTTAGGAPTASSLVHVLCDATASTQGLSDTPV